MHIDYLFFGAARNDLDSKYKELCNCCADLIRIQGLSLGLAAGVPDHRVSKKQSNEGVANLME